MAKKKITPEQIYQSNQYCLRLLNWTIEEMNKTDKSNTELINYYQREINEIADHMDSMGFK